MVVLNGFVIDEAKKTHADWSASLSGWETTVKGALWRSFSDVRATYRTVDRVGSYYVFNIAHNKARLIATIDFEDQTVTVVRIQSHAEYTRKGV